MEKDIKLTQVEIAQIKHNAIQERIKKFNKLDDTDNDEN